MVEEFFQRCGVDIVARLTESAVTVRLWSDGVLTHRELELVSTLDTSAQRRKLVEILCTKSAGTIRTFVDAVRDVTASQEDLVQKLEAELERMESRATSKHPDVPEGIWFGVNEVVHNFCGREAELAQLHKLVTANHDDSTDTMTYSVLTSVHGLGGIGKTTLARKYAWSQRDFYGGNAVWINCERGELMRDGFVRLARQLRLEMVSEFTGEPLSDRELSTAVYEWFSNHTSACLFIFDNVEEFSGPEGVRSYLPSNLAPHIRRPHVLITSRRSDLIKNGKVLPLDVFSWEDAISLVRITLPSSTTEVVERFVRMLGRLPLALQQALAYVDEIKEVVDGGEDEVLLVYMREYERNATRLLDDPKFMDHFLSEDEYKKTVYLTWRVTLDKIADLENGSLAIQTLHQLAFFNPDNIWLTYFCKLEIEEDPDRPPNFGPPAPPPTQLVRAVSLLSKYSMINCTRGIVSLHRLVQDVIRLDIGSETETLIVGLLVRLTVDNLPRTEFGEQTLLHGAQVLPFYRRNSCVIASYPEFGSEMAENAALIQYIVQQLPRESEADCVRLLDTLDMNRALIEMAVAFVKRAIAGSRSLPKSSGPSPISVCYIRTYIRGVRFHADNQLQLGSAFALAPQDLRTMVDCWTASFLQLELGEVTQRLCSSILPYLNPERLTVEFLTAVMNIVDGPTPNECQVEVQVAEALKELESLTMIKLLEDGHWRLDTMVRISLVHLSSSQQSQPQESARISCQILRYVYEQLNVDDRPLGALFKLGDLRRDTMEIAGHGFALSSHLFGFDGKSAAVVERTQMTTSDSEFDTANFFLDLHWSLHREHQSQEASLLASKVATGRPEIVPEDCERMVEVAERIHKLLMRWEEEDVQLTVGWKEALGLCDELILIQKQWAGTDECKNFAKTLRLKSQLLTKLGRRTEALAVETAAYKLEGQMQMKTADRRTSLNLALKCTSATESEEQTTPAVFVVGRYPELDFMAKTSLTTAFNSSLLEWSSPLAPCLPETRSEAAQPAHDDGSQEVTHQQQAHLRVE